MQNEGSTEGAPLHAITTSPLSVNYAHSLQRMVSLPHQTVSSVSYINPLFHFTSPDVSISAMEHNNHCKLLAIATSSKELYVVETQMMPVLDRTFSATTVQNSKSPTLPCTPPFDRRLINWSLKEMSMCIDTLPDVATQLNWGPWQYGVHLAAMCPRREIRLYRFSHACWLLQTRVFDSTVVYFTFSPNFMLTCACGDANVVLYTQVREDNLHEALGELRSAQLVHNISNKRNNYCEEPMESFSNVHINSNHHHHHHHHRNNGNSYANINKHLNTLEKWTVCGRIDNSTHQCTAVDGSNNDSSETSCNNNISSVGNNKRSVNCTEGEKNISTLGEEHIKKVNQGMTGKEQPYHSSKKKELGVLTSQNSEVKRQEERMLQLNETAITSSEEHEQNFIARRRALQSTRNVEQCICVDWNDNGSLLAAAYANGIIKVYKCNNIDINNI